MCISRISGSPGTSPQSYIPRITSARESSEISCCVTARKCIKRKLLLDSLYDAYSRSSLDPRRFAISIDDLQDVVDNPADSFESHAKIRVTDEAKRALCEPAIPHLPHINDELRAERIDLEFIKIIRAVLENAAAVSTDSGLDYIGTKEIEVAIKGKCILVPWC